MAKLTSSYIFKHYYVKASSLLETVFAMVIIAVMLVIGSSVYAVVTRSKSTLQELNEQGIFFSTVIQEAYLKEMNTIPWEGTYTFSEEIEVETDAYKVIRLTSERGKILGTYVLYPTSIKLEP